MKKWLARLGDFVVGIDRAEPRFVGRFDGRVAVVLVIAAAVLAFERFWGDRDMFESTFWRFRTEHWFTIASFGWWAAAKVFGYLVVPLIVCRALGLRPSEWGLSGRGFFRHLWIYAALYLAILPVLYLASRTGAFTTKYPMYKAAARSWSDFFAWEAMYAATFLALEAFFRGFMLFPLRRTFGVYSVFVMCVPYCMIHFGKPPAEAYGAIGAGVLLGTLALWARSIWGGVVLHIAVAWTMDILAMMRTTGWPNPDRYIG
jgi:membrane protease YdiL (CAAX protease family)